MLFSAIISRVVGLLRRMGLGKERAGAIRDEAWAGAANRQRYALRDSCPANKASMVRAQWVLAERLETLKRVNNVNKGPRRQDPSQHPHRVDYERRSWGSSKVARRG
jgi:hypothetical protein